MTTNRRVDYELEVSIGKGLYRRLLDIEKAATKAGIHPHSSLTDSERAPIGAHEVYLQRLMVEGRSPKSFKGDSSDQRNNAFIDFCKEEAGEFREVLCPLLEAVYKYNLKRFRNIEC